MPLRAKNTRLRRAIRPERFITAAFRGLPKAVPSLFSRLYHGAGQDIVPGERVHIGKCKTIRVILEVAHTVPPWYN